MGTQDSHVAFSDESNWNDGRFRSLGLVTTPLANLEQLETELRNLLLESGVKEFKWKELGGARERFAALKMCDFAIKKARAGQLRVDVLIWDITDNRHNVKARDDVANLQRMYYHLFRNVLRMRWRKGAKWMLYPDEHTAMDWGSVGDYLERKSENLVVERSLFSDGRRQFRLQKEFAVEKVVQCRSGDHALLQLADLFSGIAVFSREHFADYQKWLAATSSQPRLFGDTQDDNPSLRSTERFNVLKMLDQKCKSRRLGVSLKTSQGLVTPNPENPLNFWLYEPQHPEDKAPTRG